jgi:hypothetical protein
MSSMGVVWQQSDVANVGRLDDGFGNVTVTLVRARTVVRVKIPRGLHNPKAAAALAANEGRLR